jgi:ectoine hydroxylase-related dioxygenase (phytanoyl-CoA dioxygenase family)
MSLTPEQVRLLRHNGFIKLPGRLSAERVAGLKEAIWRDIREEAEPIVRDRQGRAVRISAIWDRDPIFRETLTSPEVLDPLEALLGPNIELVRNRHNHATLRYAEEGADYMHRDILQWSRTIVTVLFYLEETTVENGCTRVVPGSHLFPGATALSLREDEQIQRAGILDQAVPVPMPAGGLLAIDSFLMHGAGRNQTEGTRISMTVGYHSVDELSDVDNPKRVLVRGTRLYKGNDT